MGDHFQRCLKEQVPFGGGRPLPGPEGVSRYMYGTVYVPTYYTVLRTGLCHLYMAQINCSFMEIGIFPRWIGVEVDHCVSIDIAIVH